MPDKNPIYDFLKANNLTDKDEATFLREYSDSAKAKELYSFFETNKLTDKDFNGFYDTYLKKKEVGGAGLAAGAAYKPLTEQQKIKQSLGTVSVSSDKTAPQKEYQPEFDTDDPVKSALNPIRNKLAEYRQKPVSESTAQNPLLRQQKSKATTDLLFAQDYLEKQNFSTENEALGWLEPKLDKSKLVLKGDVTMNKPVITLDDYTPESVAAATNPQNETDQLALRKYMQVRDVKEVLSKSPNLEKAAINLALKKEGLLSDQIEALGGNIPAAMRANILSQFLTNKNLFELASKDNELMQKVNTELYNLPQKYPTAAITVMADLISAEREKRGYNNAILNVTSEKTNDKIVDELTESGALPRQYKDMYDRPEVRFMVNAKLKTPGLVENVAEGLGQGLLGIGKSAAEITGIRDLYKSDADKLYEGLQKQYESFRFKPKGAIHEITTTGGNIIGQFLPTAIGGNALLASKIVTNPMLANSIMIGLQSYGENKDQAEIDLAGKSKNEKESYALLNTAIEIASENILNDVKLAKQIATKYKPEIKNILSKFTAKEISAEAAEKGVKDIFANIAARSGQFAKGTLKVAEAEAREELAANIANNVVKQVFTGEDMSALEMASQAFDVYKTSFMGGLLLGGFGGINQVRRNPATQEIVYSIAQNPEYYKEIVQGQAQLDPEYAKDLKQKLSNIDYAAAVAKALDSRDDLSYKQKQKFLVTSLNEKMLQEKVADTPDKALTQNEEKQLKAIKIEKQSILDPERGVQKEVEEFYDADLLPPGSKMLLENEEGKFSPAKVGEYLKFIAQQSNNLDENWNPHKGKAPTMPGIPEQIIEIANERWKKEIDNAKSKEYAIQERSTEEIPLGETPGYSPEMGGRTPESGQTIEEGKTEGQKEVQIDQQRELDMGTEPVSEKPSIAVQQPQEVTKPEVALPTTKVNTEDWSRDVESTAKALEEVDKTPINRLNALSNAEKIDKGSGSQVRYMSLADLNELARDMIANEKDYQDKLQDAQGVYNLTIERIEEISESYHKSKKDGTNPELVKAVEDLLGKPNEGTTKVQEKAGEQVGSVEDEINEIQNKIEELLRKRNSDIEYQKIVQGVRNKINTLEELDAASEKWANENGLTDLIKQQDKLKKEKNREQVGSVVDKAGEQAAAGGTKEVGAAKAIADKVRSLKVDLSKLSGGGAQSNVLGLPVAVWNGAMDIVATTIEAGGQVADAIKRGLNYIQKNHRGQWDKKSFNDQVMKELGVRGITVNGQDLIVKDVEPEFAETINGFYSDIEQSILDVSPTDKGTPQAWLKKIGTGEEAKWTGITDWLNSLPKDQKISRKEVLDWMKDNRIQVVEVVKGVEQKVESQILEDETYNNINDELSRRGIEDEEGILDAWYYAEENKNEKWGNVVDFLNKNNLDLDYLVEKSEINASAVNDTKFSQYQLEGEKSNYKEVLVTLPSIQEFEIVKVGEPYQILNKKTGEYLKDNKGYVIQEYSRIDAQNSLEKQKQVFKSSHFDEPNILVHLRMNTRTDAEGKKVLFLEEIQSDFAQKYRKEGGNLEAKKYDAAKEFYYNIWIPFQRKEINKQQAEKEFDELSKRTGISKEDIQDTGHRYGDFTMGRPNVVPEAPFITETSSWVRLGLKVALKEGVRQNASTISWTTGEQQNERYDLSKQIDEVYYSNDGSENGWSFSAVKNGQEVMSQENLTLKQVEDYLGKEVAEKMSEQEGKFTEGDWGVEPKKLSNVDLKVGGKGMKGFYGEPSEGKLGIVGEVARSLFKQEPGTISIETAKNNEYTIGEANYVGGVGVYDGKGDMIAEFDTKKDANDFIKSKQSAKQQSITITPELRQEAESGLPLFKDIKGRGKEIADVLRKAKIKSSGLQSNIAGIPAALWNAAIDTIALAIEGGATLAQAVQKAIKKHNLDKQKGFNQKEFISKLEQASGEKLVEEVPPGEPEEIRLTHADTEQIYDAAGLPLRTETPVKKKEQLEQEAEEILAKGYDFDKVAAETMLGDRKWEDTDQLLFARKVADLKAQQKGLDINSPEFEALQNQIEKYSRASDVAGTIGGRFLQSRKHYQPLEETLADYVMQEKEDAKVTVLTEKQKETLQKEFNDIQQAQMFYEQKMQALKEEYEQKLAEAAVNNVAKTTKKGQKKDFKKEREEIFASIKDKLKKARSETSVVAVPYAKELIAIAPDVAKLVKSYVEQGITELSEIVKNIKADLGDDKITERDIRGMIAGEYNEQKPTRNKLAADLVSLKQEAKLINQLEEYESGGEPKSETKKIQRNRKIDEIKAKLKPYTDLKAYKTKTKTEIEKIQKQIQSGDYSVPQKKPPLKLDKEAIELRDNLIRAKQQREARRHLVQRQNEGSRERALRYVAEVANVPRTLMTIGDFSGLLRQNIFFSAGHPIRTAQALPGMFKAAVSQKEYDRWFADLRESDKYQLIKDSKLAISDSLSHDLSEREEDFMSTLAEKIPVIGRSLKTESGKTIVPGLNIVKGSERSYTMLLNKMRVDVFLNLAEKLENRGLTFENSPKVYKALAEYVNNATGRSDFGKHLNRIAPILNSAFFSPRLIASRINMLTYWAQPRFWKTLPKEARIDYFRNWLSLLATGMTILALAKMGGADVEDDPRSSDFGKIKSGNTRWDIWGGAQPYVRVLAQIVTGKRKSTASGKLYDLNGDDIFGETRAGVASDFFRNKLAPVPGMMVDVLSGRTSVGDRIVYQWGGAEGKEISLDEYVKQRLLPMTITGTEEAMKDQGVKSLFTVGVPQLFGVGTQTYSAPNPPVSREKRPILVRPQRP